MQNVLQKDPVHEEPHIDVLASKYVGFTKPVEKVKKRRVLRITKKSSVSNQLPLAQKYIKHLPLLLLAGLCYAITASIFTFIDPEKIRNVILTNAYFPLLGITAIGHFFLFTFFFLHIRRGILMSIFLTLLLFCQLQQVLYWQVIVFCTLPLLLIEVVLTLGNHAST